MIKQNKMRSLQKVFLIMLLISVLIPTVQAYLCPPCFAHVDKIDPEIECLEIRGSGGCGGQIVVSKNTCSDTVYIYSSAWEKYEVPSAREPQQFLPGETGNIRTGIVSVEEFARDYFIEICEKEKIEYGYEELYGELCKLYEQYEPYLGDCHKLVVSNDEMICADNLKRGAIVRNWTFSGWVGNQNFTVTGRTIYKKPRNISIFLFLSILVGAVLLIFGIKYKKQSLIICGCLLTILTFLFSIIYLIVIRRYL